MVYDVYVMIRKTVYFRTQEDLDKFNALPNKAEWLHIKLSPATSIEVHNTEAVMYTEPEETA